MASNVLRTPVTTETLMGMAEFQGKIIRPVDRARVALEMKNVEGKDVNARKYVEGLLDTYRTKQRPGGDGTMCLFYNATGDPVTYYAHNNSSGAYYLYLYPAVIENGQWGAYLHAHFTTASAKGGVAYRGTIIANTAGPPQFGLYIFTWRQRNNVAIDTVRVNFFSCMTGIVTEPASIGSIPWDTYDHPERASSISSYRYQSVFGPSLSFASIGSGNSSVPSRSPIFEGIMTLADGATLKNAGVDSDPDVDASVEGTTTLVDAVESRIPDVDDNADADADADADIE